jgi:DNA-binding NtrC family response regulator
MKILVVDDDRRIVKTTCDILKFKGYEPIPAFTGEEGIEKVRSATPDCVLMDIKMPGINGVEAMKRMKEIAPSLTIVLVTAYATEDLMEEAKQAGAYAVLSKPVNFQMILSFLSLLAKEENVLIVDDDPDFLTTLKGVLTLRGYRVKTESEPDNVLGRLEEDSSFVVLLDLKLGNVNGVDVLERIREKYPDKPVIMVTGYPQEMSESVAKGLRLGAYSCLYKPFEVDSLIGLVEEIRLKKLKSLLIVQ